jgi:molybdenum cofactor cytidylyltransferase
MASGFSRRFAGADKLLSPFRGKPLARHTLELAAGLVRTGVFTRAFFIVAADEVAALASGLPVTIIRNGRPGLGQRESIRLGAAASEADYFMFFPCDQPLLDRTAVLGILEARREGCIVEPGIQGEGRNPCVFSRVFREELCSLPPGGKGRDIKARHQDRVISVEVAEPLRFTDIDSPEDLV